jgi:hypothetical protein
MNYIYLPTMFKEARETARRIEISFGSLDTTQLNWQDAPTVGVLASASTT